MVILVDANVIIDYVASREPFYRDAYKIMEMCYSKKVEGYMAFHSVSIIWYILRKFIPDGAERRIWMRKILQMVQVTKAVEMENFRDFEDCLQNKCAETVNAQYIVTNNVKDFKESTIQAITPLDFCDLLV